MSEQTNEGLGFLIELLGLVSGQLDEATQSDLVVGQSIDLGGVQIVPLSRMSVGMGVGGGMGEGDDGRRFEKKRRRKGHGKGIGGASGMGAKVRPVGVAIFTEDGVEVMPIADRKGIVDRIFDKVPQVIELVENAAKRWEGKAELPDDDVN